MPWYRQGTVSITAGQTTVTGAGTNFPANARVGDAFQGPDGRWYEVTNIASSTVLSILPAYQGATVSAGAYGLAPMQGYVKESADRLRQVVEQYGTTLALFGNAADVVTLRTNIGAAKSGANNDITSLTGMTTALSIAQGGTGSATSAAAKTALGIGDVGVGQSWQNMLSQRSLGTLYTNTTGRPIQVIVHAGPASSVNTALNITIGGAVVYAGYAGAAGVYIATATAIVPPSATYSVGASNGSVSALTAWNELR
ncbi:hypothetical protein P5705_05210 [Pseudomonas entomophila]|uniref:hypothetical protein n=1 Tax=Pseudomonas entomophila TaxID=312306 RepID=UPI002405BE94|nr:hypothetical protein [Pseudomonas entomophila]MDF9617032.1 hypothetical protein [Pseudomonas entomophila]